MGSFFLTMCLYHTRSSFVVRALSFRLHVKLPIKILINQTNKLKKKDCNNLDGP